MTLADTVVDFAPYGQPFGSNADHFVLGVPTEGAVTSSGDGDAVGVGVPLGVGRLVGDTARDALGVATGALDVDVATGVGESAVVGTGPGDIDPTGPVALSTTVVTSLAAPTGSDVPPEAYR